MNPPDPIREAFIRQAKKLGLTGYAIEKACAGEVSEDSITRYLTRRGNMTTEKLHRLLPIVKMRIVVE